MPNVHDLEDADTSHTWSGLPPFDIKVISGQLAARDALRQVMERLQPLSLGSEDSNIIEIVLAEALNNIIEHAYAEIEGAIEIGCRHFADGLHFCLRDRGCALPNGQLPAGKMTSKDVELQELPEGGFGWFLIKDLARDVTYLRVDDTNRLELRIAIAQRCPV